MCFDTPDSARSGPAHPEDVLTGYPVGANGDRAFCTACRRELRAGHAATVYAYRLAGAALWDVPRVYCERDAPDDVAIPTLGAIEVVATATIEAATAPGGDGRRLCLSDVRIAGHSPPEEGAPP